MRKFSARKAAVIEDMNRTVRNEDGGKWPSLFSKEGRNGTGPTVRNGETRISERSKFPGLGMNKPGMYGGKWNWTGSKE